jgi:hypothetical protein
MGSPGWTSPWQWEETQATLKPTAPLEREGDTILPPFIIRHSGVTNSPSFRLP